MKIKFNSDDDLPLNKLLKFHLMTITMKVSGQKLDQRLKELIVERKFFMKKVIVKLALILKMICLQKNH